jgi:hypothetical protein
MSGRRRPSTPPFIPVSPATNPRGVCSDAAGCFLCEFRPLQWCCFHGFPANLVTSPVATGGAVLVVLFAVKVLADLVFQRVFWMW